MDLLYSDRIKYIIALSPVRGQQVKLHRKPFDIDPSKGDDLVRLVHEYEESTADGHAVQYHPL